MKIGAKKTKNYRYNDWLEYFGQLPAAELQKSQEELADTLPSEGYAALMRWLEIFENPSKMDKLSQGRIKAQKEASIMEVAVGDDDEAFYMDLIRKNVSELEGASPQEVARLSQNINIYRKQLQEIRSHKPKANSTLSRVLKAADLMKADNKTPKPAAKRKTTTKTAKKRITQKKDPSKTPPKAKKSVKTISKASGEKDG
jgi:hypothetical protein